jgi:hypothetical protein
MFIASNASQPTYSRHTPIEDVMKLTNERCVREAEVLSQGHGGRLPSPRVCVE